METAITLVDGQQVSSSVQQAAERARDYAKHADAANTLRAYRADWADFTTWCEGAGRISLPAAPETVALYLAARAPACKVSTLQRRLSAISRAHQAAGYEFTTRVEPLKRVWKGIRNKQGTAQTGKAPVMTEDIKAMLAALPANLLGIRDRAMLLLGFATAFRRSELVSLNVNDLEFTRDGLVVTLRKSKTDQEQAGRKIGIPYVSRPDLCPVRALQGWLEASSITSGALFRSINRHGKLQPGRLTDQAVAIVVKRAAAAANLNPDRFAGHSLRAGHATSAAANGAPERVIMAQTGHKSLNMVRRYIRDGNLFRENSATYLGL
jgi:site-specific recombinase XerD